MKGVQKNESGKRQTSARIMNKEKSKTSLGVNRNMNINTSNNQQQQKHDGDYQVQQNQTNHSHFSLNNLQPASNQKQHFYSPKNNPQSLQTNLMNIRPVTSLSKNQQTNTMQRNAQKCMNSSSKNTQQLKQKGGTVNQQIKNLTQEQQNVQLNSKNKQIQQLNQSNSNNNLNYNSGRATLNVNQTYDSQCQGKISNNTIQESTMITFSPSSNNQKMSPQSSQNFISNQLQQQLNNVLSQQHLQIQPNQNAEKIDSFKSTFVNFRISMVENARANQPIVRQFKNSPVTSPTRVLQNQPLSQAQQNLLNFNSPQTKLSKTTKQIKIQQDKRKLKKEELLWHYSETGDIIKIEQLIELNNIDVNIQNSQDEGWTALHYAANEGQDQVIELLIRKYNANVDLKSSNGRAALHIACNRLNQKVIERLLLGGANANIQQEKDGNTPLHILAQYSCDDKLIKLLLPFSKESLKIINKHQLKPYQMTNNQEIINLLQYQNNDKKQINLQQNQIQQQYIVISNYQNHEVNWMFHKMNQQMKLNSPILQPLGEEAFDNLTFSSFNNQSFQKVDIQQKLVLKQQNTQQKAQESQQQQQTKRNSINSQQGIQQQKVNVDQFIAHQLLGTGSFGEVYLVEKLSSKKLYAMKVLTKSKIKSQNLIKYALTERNVMSIMIHPFVVRLRYAFQTSDKLFLICDYCPGGDLSQYLEIEGAFSEEKAKFYIQEILLAIEDLHQRDIIFRDLKPDNVVLDETGHALLTDFGLSKEGISHFHQHEAKSFCGSYAYLAPEMIKKQGHGKAVDWYLLGVVLYEMLTGMPPYYADEKDILFKNILSNRLELPRNISPQCQSFLKQLLERNPLKRLGSRYGANEIKQHPFFRGINWQDVYNKKYIPPQPYLAEYAKNIIQVSPYMAAGHPKTRGKPCFNGHPQYIQGWSFACESNDSGIKYKAKKRKIDQNQAIQQNISIPDNLSSQQKNSYSQQ